MKLSYTKWILIYFSCALQLAAGMDKVWVELRAPRFVVHGHSAVLKCDHNADANTLYKVVFFKSGQRIMQYVQGRDPPFELYNFTGADINLIMMTPTSITLEKMDFPASGHYACEVALEIPLFSKGSKIHEVSVIVRQKHRPKIKIKHKKLFPYSDLEATCQSASAYPAPHLTWLINNNKVDEKLTIPHGTVSANKHHHGMPLSLTTSSLRYPLSNIKLLPNRTVDVTCLSTIPSYPIVGGGYADLQNQTIAVNVVRMEPTPTQLPVRIITLDNTSSNSVTITYNYIQIIILCFTITSSGTWNY